jgi:hypothetical protein
MHIQKTQALFVHVLTDDLLSAYQVLSIVPGTIHIPLTHPLPLSLSHAHTHTHTQRYRPRVKDLTFSHRRVVILSVT